VRSPAAAAAYPCEPESGCCRPPYPQPLLAALDDEVDALLDAARQLFLQLLQRQKPCKGWDLHLNNAAVITVKVNLEDVTPRWPSPRATWMLIAGISLDGRQRWRMWRNRHEGCPIFRTRMPCLSCELRYLSGRMESTPSCPRLYGLRSQGPHRSKIVVQAHRFAGANRLKCRHIGSHLHALLLIGVELPERQNGLDAVAPQPQRARKERQPRVRVRLRKYRKHREARQNVSEPGWQFIGRATHTRQHHAHDSLDNLHVHHCHEDEDAANLSRMSLGQRVPPSCQFEWAASFVAATLGAGVCAGVCELRDSVSTMARSVAQQLQACRGSASAAAAGFRVFSTAHGSYRRPVA